MPKNGPTIWLCCLKIHPLSFGHFLCFSFWWVGMGRCWGWFGGEGHLALGMQYRELHQEQQYSVSNRKTWGWKQTQDKRVELAGYPHSRHAGQIQHLANVWTTTCDNRGNTPEEIQSGTTPRRTFTQLTHHQKVYLYQFHNDTDLLSCFSQTKELSFSILFLVFVWLFLTTTNT